MTKNTVPERRKEIVEATLRQVPKLCNGLLSTQAIANHIGITQAGLFRHVPTKKDLRIVVLTEIECRARRAWDEASRGYDPSVVRLRRILLAQIKLIEDYPAIPALLFSTGWLAAKEVVYPIHVRIMTALRLRVTEELSAAVRECDRHIQIDTLDMESLLMGVVQDRELCWSLTGRKYSLVAKGDRMIGLQLCLSVLESWGD